MSGFQGSHARTRQGPISQRELVAAISALVDAAKARSASRTRDEARASLRWLLDNANWNTGYVCHNVGVRRCKFIAAMGYPVPYAFLDATRGRERLDRLAEKANG